MRIPLIIFIASSAFVFYIVIGYPVLLSILSRYLERPIKKAWEPRSVTVILPVLNGEAWIRNKLESIVALDYPKNLVDIIVVSDGSTDRTEDVVREFALPRLSLVSVPRGGKSRALSIAIRRSESEILFFTDVRQPLDAKSLRNLVSCLSDEEVGVVSGELVLRAGNSQEEANTGLYWRYEKWIRKALSKIDSVPGATGCIYAMRRSLAVSIPDYVLADDMFLPIAAFLKGFRVVFEESAIAYDEPMRLKTEFRRKVRTLAGVFQIISIHPRLLFPGTRMWFHFLSHKAGRLLLPWALLANLATSFYLPFPWKGLALAAHFTVYALAVLDFFMPESLFIKKITSPARTFVTLMLASLCAIAVLFLPSEFFWKTASNPIQKPVRN